MIIDQQNDLLAIGGPPDLDDCRLLPINHIANVIDMERILNEMLVGGPVECIKITGLAIILEYGSERAEGE